MRRYSRKIAYRPPREEDEKQAGDLSLYLRFLREYIFPHKGLVGLCILLVTMNIGSVYLMAYYGRVVVDQILVVTPLQTGGAQGAAREATVPATDRRSAAKTLPRRGMTSEPAQAAGASSRPPGAGAKLLQMFILYVLTIVGLNLATRLAQRIRIEMSRVLTTRMREDIHSKVLSLPRAFHLARTPGRLMARILSDVGVVQAQMMSTIVDSSSYFLMFVAGIALVMAIDWRIAVACLLVMIPYAFVIQRSRLRITEVNRELAHTNACLWGLVSQKLDAVRAIFAYNRERSERLTFHRLAACFLRDAFFQQRLGARVNLFAQIITGGTTIGIFLFCGRLVLAGSMSLGKMMFVHVTAANLFTPVLVLTQMALVFNNLLVVLQRVTQILDHPLEIEEAPGAVDFPAKLHSGIALRDVSFGYSRESEPVLKHINLTIPAGRWVCIMGPSGSGKSSLLYLLSRLYDTTSGEILVDGIPLDAIKLDSLRRQVVLVSQEPELFSGTVRDNITYGDPDAEPSDIMAAATAADCHHFIMELPVQYESTMGEKGMTLSGGQRQRISMARAFLTDPQVLLLDDCTAALDARTERRIQETLSGLLQGKTAIIVTQRISMAMRCDRIYVFENGEIAEAGTHHELVANGGFYSRVHAQQTS